MDDLSQFYKKLSAYHNGDDDALTNESQYQRLPNLDSQSEEREVATASLVPPPKEADADFWKKINNNGFLVYETDNQFCLRKFKTPSMDGEIDPELYSTIIDVFDRIELYAPPLPKFGFIISLMFNTGSSYRFEDIKIKTDNPDVATELAIDQIVKKYNILRENISFKIKQAEID